MNRLFFFLASILVCSTVLAQRPGATPKYEVPEKRYEIGVQHGFGWWRVFNDRTGDATIVIRGDTTEAISTIRSTYASTLLMDYYVNEMFSVGPALSYQGLTFNYEPLDPNTPEGSIRISRIFLNARALFHYGRSEHFKMYSGLRLGATIWAFSGEADITNSDFDQLRIQGGAGVLPTVTPILFGFKAYAGDVVLGGELAVGSPHILAVQVGYRF